ALAETSIALFTHAAQAKGLALTLDFPAGAARLVGDAARLQQIMFNLLSNAIKFTATGSVTLSVAAPDAPANIWTVRVRDTGIGLPDQAQATLFRPFAQGDTSIARRFGGTGLGLAISLKLAEAMGGSLTAEAVTGSGACLRLDLPLASAGDVTTNEPDAVGIPTRARTVLVAEDHPANRLLLETWLRRQGHQVCCVDDGAAAVAEVVTTRFDLVLMDLQMPEMDGIAASRAIRELAGAAALTPIVALSADVLSHREDQLAAVGVVDRLAKPIDFALLASVLETLPDRNEASPATIDPAKLDQLLGLMTDEETARFIALIDDELVNATARLVVALRRGDDALARRLAHRSIGALTNIGAMALIALLRPIADGPVIERRAQVIAAIVTAAAATRLHIGKYVQLRSSAVNAE
ncbi:MAG: ATP-binding protein, partial [Sphingomonas sp.]